MAGHYASVQCEGAKLGVLDLCHFDLLKRACANSVVGLSGKKKAHKHKQIFPVTGWAGGGGSPDRWPGFKSLCAVCGTQGT